MKKIVLGITPARGGSKGIHRKNLVDLGGIPLVGHTIRAAQGSALLDNYVVSSEDDEIRSVSESFGAMTMTRPEKYSHDQILQEVDLLLRWTVLEFEKSNHGLEVDVVVLLYPTAPLRVSSDIDKCIELVKSGEFDSALTVYHDQRYLWAVQPSNAILPLNYDPNNRMPRQKEVWNQWAENKAVYVMKRDVLFDKGRVGENCGFIEMNKIRSIDIDSIEDLNIARAILGLDIAN